MNTQIITTEPIVVKPCIKCGAEERYASGGCKPCSRKHREANLEKILAYGEQWREANREYCRQYAQNWQEANRDQTRELARQYRKDNPEKIKQSKINWEKSNPEKHKAISVKRRQNRRAKKLGNGGKLSKGIIDGLLALQKGKCACCGASLKNGYHLDHIMPLALGGQNSDNNVQLLTPICNWKKGAKHPDDWARENGKLL
jgi:hypothetical protein